jgi:phage protein D
MPHDHLFITINGQEITNFYPDLLKVEVELDDELAGMFRLRFGFQLMADGSWTNVDEDVFRVWNPITIEGGFEDNSEELLRGYITQVKVQFEANDTQVALDVWGTDESVLLDREEKLKDWANKKDSDIATELFAGVGLAPQVEDTGVVHDEAVSTTIQRDTDMQFLKRLALRNGYECYVEGGIGYFGPPDLDSDPQPVLAAHFGEKTTLGRFYLTVDGLRPTNIAMAQMDRTTKEKIDVLVEVSQQDPLGTLHAAQVPGANADRAAMVVGLNGATGHAEMSALCQSIFHRAEWFVTGEGEVWANEYGHILRPRKKVTIKGLGETYSGIYYVSHVTHTFTPSGYSQNLRVKRNALLLTGDEDFAGSVSFAAGLL